MIIQIIEGGNILKRSLCLEYRKTHTHKNQTVNWEENDAISVYL